jgi:hypothetical protein
LLPLARNVSGTETNFNVTAGSIAALAGGVFYASQFSGATADVIVNACITAAIAAGNGICDARSLVGNQTIAATINVGNASNAPVTLLLPAFATWTTSINDGASCAIKQFTLTNIVGSDLELRMQIRNGSPTNGLFCLYTNNGGGYYRASGFTLYNPNVTMAGPAAMVIAGAFDNSVYRNIEVLNYFGNAIQIGGSGNPCCSVGLYNLTGNCNYTGGIPLNILANNATGTPNGVYFFGGSFDHPGAGKPNIACTDTSTAHNTTIGFFGVYEEGSNSDTTTALNQISGCGSVTVVGMEVKAETASSVAPIWTISNTKATSFQLMGLAALVNFTLPATAVVNNFTGQTISTDAAGYLPQYNSGISYFNSVNTNSTVTFGGTIFANLGTVVNGAMTYCSDCNIANPCTGGGNGAMAKGLNSAWVCN